MDSNFQGYDSLAERRQRLASAMRSGGGSQRLLSGNAFPLFGGLGGGPHSSVDLPPAALPGLSFNPFFAQMAAGRGGIMTPSHPGSAPDQPNMPPLPPQAGGGPRWLGGFGNPFYGENDIEDPWLGHGAVT